MSANKSNNLNTRRPKKPTKPSLHWYIFRMLCCFVLGAPFVVAGIICLLCVITAPVGFALLGAAGGPMALNESNRVRRLHNYYKALDEYESQPNVIDGKEVAKPWL